MKNRKEVLLSAVYIGIMGVGMTLSYRGFGIAYSNPGIVVSLFPFEIVMTLMSVIVYLKHYRRTSFGRLHPTPSFVIYAAFLLVIASISIYEGSLFEEREILFFVIGTNLLVGISEELMFRGIVLHGFLVERTKLESVLLSSLLFSLLHSVNVLAGFSPADMSIQLVNTFIFGVFASLMAIDIGTILPLMAIHAIWDTIVSSNAFVMDHAVLVASFMLLEIVIAIVLLARLYRDEHGKGRNGGDFRLEDAASDEWENLQ